MLRISLVDGQRQRKLIVEGILVTPWVSELTIACEKARADLKGRELIVDLRSLTGIGSEGESVLLQLMNENVKFQCGVYMKEVLRQLARKSQRSPQDVGSTTPDGDSDV